MHKFSVFAFVYNSLTIKSAKEIFLNQALTVSSEYIRWLIVHNHAHCLLRTVTNSCMWGTSYWWSAGHFRKSEKCWKRSKNRTKNKDKEISVPNESRSCFCHVTNFRIICGFIHTRFKRFGNSADPSRCSATLAFSLQVIIIIITVSEKSCP